MRVRNNASNWRKTTAGCALLVVQMVFGHVSQAETPSQNCELYPFALSWHSVSNTATGATLNNLADGSGFAWLSWNGQTSKKALLRSLTPPGTSSDYKDPDDANDRVLNLGDWVRATSAENAKDVRHALDDLKGVDVVVPVWDQKRSKSNKGYRVYTYARVSLVDYNLKKGHISVRFVRFVNCESANLPPVVRAGDDLTVTHPAPANLSGVVSDDSPPNAKVQLTVVWTKVSGPGTVTFGNAASATTTASFSLPGTYVLRLTASDGEFTVYDEVTVTVNSGNRPPVAHAQSVSTGEDSGVAITVSGSDPDGNTLSCAIVSPPRFGALSGILPNVVYTPRPNFFGADSFTFSMSDGTLESSPAQVSISVSAVNDAPVAQSQAVSGNEDSSIPVLLSGADVEGSPLTFVVLQSPAHGTLTGANAQWSYTPAANFHGPDQFTFKANDGAFDSAPATVSLTVRPVNDPPIPLGQTVSSNEDSPLDLVLTGTDPENDALTFEVLSGPARGSLSGSAPNLRYTPAANFHGVDAFTFRARDAASFSAPATVNLTVTPVNDPPLVTGQSLTLDEDGQLTVVLSGTDVDGDVLTFTVVDGPLHGSLTGTPSNLTYVPVANFNGTDQFTFNAGDGTLVSAVATVALAVRPVNDPPVALAHSVSLNEDAFRDLVLGGNDPDNDTVTFEIVGQPGHGTVTGTPPNIRYTPSANFFGSDVFSFVVRDASSISAPATVNLTVMPVNDPPLATGLSLALDEDGQLTVVLSGTDVDNDPLSFTVVDGPVHGSLTGTPPNLTYVAAANFNGTDQFTFNTRDGAAVSSSATVSLTVRAVNDAPVALAQSVSLSEDTPGDLVLAGNDADNDTLTFEIVDHPGYGTVTGTPPNIRYTPAADFFGNDAFSFVVRDGSSVSAPATLSLTVTPVNDLPVGTGLSVTLEEDSQATVALSGTDVDGDALTFTVTGSPSHGTLSGTLPNLTYVPAANFNGTDSFEFVVADASANSSTTVVSLTVTPVNDAPAASSQSISLAEDTTADVLLSGTDVEGTTLTFSIVEAPQHGSLSGQGAELRYTPTTNFNGNDSFRVVANDGQLDSTPATISVTVTPVNDAPVANAQSLTAVEAQNLPVALTGTDVDGDTLQFTVTTQPHLGRLTGTAPNVVYEAPVGVFGADYFEFVVSDGSVTAPPARVDVTVLRRVEAGPNQYTRSTSELATLQGIVRDNGLPAQIAWQKKSGPGAVTLGDSSSPVTTAGFTSNGVYLLELVVTDSVRSARDVVEVRVGSLCAEEAPAGMVAWWQASYDALDYVSGNAANLQQGTTFDVGKVGAAFRFDGVDDRVMVPATSALDVGQGAGFTVEFWMNSSDVGRAARLVGWHSGGGARAPSTNWGVNIYQASGNLNAQVYDLAGNPRDMTAFGVLQNNAWTHVALTYDRASGQGRLFLNGVLRVSVQLGTYVPRTSYNLYLGHVPVETTWYRGLLDEVSVYDRALDPQAIYNIFASAEVGKCRANGNQAPRVNAGPDMVARDTVTPVLLAGDVTDTTLPGGPLRVQWTKFSGPGNVNFADSAAAATTASFSAPGLYALSLTADDAEFSISDVVEVRVGQPCTVADVPGLVAWWPANGNASEVVGGRNALLAGGTTFNAGKVCTAFNFDGTNDFAQVPAHPSLDLGSGPGLSVEFWMNSADVSRLARLVSWHSGLALGSTNNGLNIYQSSGNLYAQFTDFSGNPREVTLFTSLVNNIWTHVAVTYDRAAGHAKIYLNGVLRLTANLGNVTTRTTYNVYFGNQPFDVGFYRGLLDEVSLYRRALDAQEVHEIFASQSSGKAPTSIEGPAVDAGPDLELATVSDVAVLNGQVTDDGLPPGLPLQTLWSRLDGPGTVTFADAQSPTTTASFSLPGIYVLKLTADDGAVVRSDVVEVRVASACTISPADLVAWWPGNGSADETVGGLNGRLAGGATFASGRVSTAFSFDGTNDAVHVPANPALDLGAGQGLTIEFWMNSADVSRIARLVGWHFGLAGPATNFGVNVYQNNANLYAQIYDQSGNPHEMTAFLGLTNNAWTHVAVTYDRPTGQGRIYLNGVVRATASLGSYRPQTTCTLFFGNLPHENNFYRGLLDEVALYSRSLAVTEIQSIYNAGAGGKCRSTSAAPNLPAPRFSAQEESLATVTVDHLGLRTQMVDPSGTTDYSYNGQRLTSVTKTWNPVSGQPAFVATLTYDYDDLGRLTGVRSSNRNGTDVRYGYNERNELTDVLDSHSGLTRYSADEAGRLVCTYPNGETTYVRLPADGAELTESDLLDADGHLALRTTGTTVTYYLTDPLNPAGPRVVEELTLDASLAAPSVTRIYTYGHHLISVEEFVNGEWQLSFNP